MNNLYRQATFNESGELSSIPSKNSEQPQLEIQSDIFTYLSEINKLEVLKHDCSNNLLHPMRQS